MKPFKKERLTIKGRFEQRKKLIKPFIKKYKQPVLVHSVNNKEVFKKILEERKLKIPKKHRSPKKCPYMEKFLGIDNAIYYSLGFVYYAAYGWKYNLIFDLNSLRELLYYRSAVMYRCYKVVVDYWYKNDKEYLEKLANKNKLTRKVVDRYYYEEYNGKARVIFDFWKIEKETFEHIRRYKDKKKLIKLIRKNEQELIRKYPYSKIDARKAITSVRTQEIIGKKDNNLLNNPHFLGFYIDGKIPKDILKILLKKYPDKIIFDGKEIGEVGELK